MIIILISDTLFDPGFVTCALLDYNWRKIRKELGKELLFYKSGTGIVLLSCLFPFMVAIIITFFALLNYSPIIVIVII